MRVVVVTRLPSPYQVELFDRVARRGDVSLAAVYVVRSEPQRPWGAAKLAHEAVFLDEVADGRLDALADSAALCVFSWYRTPRIRRLMERCAHRGQRWCFWGEAPGFRARGLVGRLYRRFAMRALHRAHVPIWGIGQWAVDRYRAEFGAARPYVDLPYFSDLSRFDAQRQPSVAHARRVLYSGSLIRRKGVDTLAAAWARVAPRFPGARLEVLGDGPLRGRMQQLLSTASGSVRFHGAVDWPQLPGYYRGCDFLCAPSRYDGWGLVVPEALAAGLPVIASTQMGASREMVRDGVNGWSVAPGEAGALAERIGHALSMSPAEYEAMSRSARASAREFDVARGSERFVQAVRAALQ